MTWKQCGIIKVGNSVFWVGNIESSCFMRAFDSIHRVDLEDTAFLVWSCHLLGDHGFSYKPVLCTNKTIITSKHRNKNPKDVTILGIDAADGQVVWEKPVDWDLHHMFGGIFLAGNRVMFIEGIQEPKLVVINAANGEKYCESAAVYTQSGVISQRSALVSTQVGSRVYYCGDEENMYCADITSEYPQLENVMDGYFSMMCSLKNDVFVVRKLTGKQEILWIDGENVQIKGRMPIPDGMEVEYMKPIYFDDESGIVVIVVSDTPGLMMVHLGENKVVWRVGVDDGWKVNDIADTPYGIVSIVQTGYDLGLRIFDKMTGVRLPFPDVNVSDMIYWAGKALFLNYGSKVNIFHWLED